MTGSIKHGGLFLPGPIRRLEINRQRLPIKILDLELGIVQSDRDRLAKGGQRLAGRIQGGEQAAIASSGQGIGRGIIGCPGQ